MLSDMLNTCCKNYIGVACVDGTCPKANEDKYIEYGIPTTSDCEDCFYYKGCKDCALNGEYCDGSDF